MLLGEQKRRYYKLKYYPCPADMIKPPTGGGPNISLRQQIQLTYWQGNKTHLSPLDEPSHSSHQLDAAKELVLRYRKGELRDRPIDEEQLWRAKTLYNSAFHPDTGNLTSIQQSEFLIPTSFKERKCFFQEECLLRSVMVTIIPP